ncbi:hypothetical protein IWX49DRAFT_592791 [Phyllosticta citricarpa]|uniref:DRBM domain-containing protein n=3 Tax=Phyllosticta TaxID=121621 RepID=A0ABR1M7S3_9PEZI
MSAQRIPWQEKLQEQCRLSQLPPPIYKEYSDRRGGRTAWSCTVYIGPHHFAEATYWYDGKYVDKAKDDAALNMLQKLEKGMIPQAHALQGLFQQQQHQQALKAEPSW